MLTDDAVTAAWLCIRLRGGYDGEAKRRGENLLKEAPEYVLKATAKARAALWMAISDTADLTLDFATIHSASPG